jgi:hypothetical protein
MQPCWSIEAAASLMVLGRLATEKEWNENEEIRSAHYALYKELRELCRPCKVFKGRLLEDEFGFEPCVLTPPKPGETKYLYTDFSILKPDVITPKGEPFNLKNYHFEVNALEPYAIIPPPTDEPDEYHSEFNRLEPCVMTPPPPGETNEYYFKINSLKPFQGWEPVVGYIVVKTEGIKAWLKHKGIYDKYFNQDHKKSEAEYDTPPKQDVSFGTDDSKSTVIQWAGNDADFACIITLLLDKKFIKAKNYTEALRMAVDHFSGVSKNIDSLMQARRNREINKETDWSKINLPEASPPKKTKKNHSIE